MKKRFGRYEVEEELAEGGMGAVYVARLRGEQGFQRKVAIKLLRADWAGDKQYEKMFVDEACIAAQLVHPSLIQVFDLGVEDGQLYMAMELLRGHSLAEIWDACRARRLRLRGDLVAWIGARVAEGLHHAHELVDEKGAPQNLVHRDVNPANVIATIDGHVKLIDFGLVHATERLSRTETGIVKGKVAYLSPEQTMGQPVDRRTDIYALAVTLWELSADRRLFKQEIDAETIAAIRDGVVEDPARFVPGYPSLLWLVLKRALSRDPADRYQNAADFARDLDGVARVEGSIVQAATVAEIVRTLFGRGTGLEAQRIPFLVPVEGPRLPPPDTSNAEPTVVKRRGPTLLHLVAYVAIAAAAISAIMDLVTWLSGKR